MTVINLPPAKLNEYDMIPLGYMYKNTAPVADWLRDYGVREIYSAAKCSGNNFVDDYITEC